MTEITAAFASLTTLFGVAVVLSVAVAGFFIGRKLLKKAV